MSMRTSFKKRSRENTIRRLNKEVDDLKTLVALHEETAKLQDEVISKLETLVHMQRKRIVVLKGGSDRKEQGTYEFLYGSDHEEE